MFQFVSKNINRKSHRHSVLNGGYSTLSNGRESINSLDDSSVKNSQSGTTDGGLLSTAANQHIKSMHTNSINSNKPSFMGSTDTINRSSNQRETLHSRFDFVKVLGKGTYGKVKLANDKRTGKQVTNCFRYFFF